MGITLLTMLSISLLHEAHLKHDKKLQRHLIVFCYIADMKKLHYKVTIKAPKQKVWDIMLDDLTYREWTKIFNPNGGTYFEGKWEEGETIRFLIPATNGKITGMYSRVATLKSYEFISLEHLGEVSDGNETPWPSSEEKMFENYTFTEHKGITELQVTMDCKEEHKAMFESSWPIALKKLKTLSEE